MRNIKVSKGGHRAIGEPIMAPILQADIFPAIIYKAVVCLDVRIDSNNSCIVNIINNTP
jgi:hypothetical protein